MAGCAEQQRMCDLQQIFGDEAESQLQGGAAKA